MCCFLGRVLSLGLLLRLVRTGFGIDSSFWSAAYTRFTHPVGLLSAYIYIHYYAICIIAYLHALLTSAFYVTYLDLIPRGKRLVPIATRVWHMMRQFVTDYDRERVVENVGRALCYILYMRTFPYIPLFSASAPTMAAGAPEGYRTPRNRNHVGNLGG